MSQPDPLAQHNPTDWQLLTEFLVPGLQKLEVEVLDHAADILGQLNLEPGQLDQILSAISQSLEPRESSRAPLRLRISVSGMALTEAQQETSPEGSPESMQELPLARGGLGFFLVKRFAGQLQEQDSHRYRLVEVLLYRE